MPRDATPYPYERWSKLNHSEARAASALARIPLHAEGSRAARMIDAVAGAIRAELTVTPGPPRSLRGDGPVATEEPVVVLELLERLDGIDHPFLLELTVELASALIDRALGGPGSLRPPRIGLDELELGALGYLAARACAASSGQFRVCGVHARTQTRSGEGAGGLAWPLALAFADTGGHARVLLPAAGVRTLAERSQPPRRFDVPSTWLGLPIALCAHAATVRLTASELLGLEPGDVVLPERMPLARGEHGWYGEATLHALGRPRGPSARCELRADLDRPRLCVAAFEPGEHAMSDESNPEALVKDAPIELCVELARFTLRLEDVLGLRAGEVLQTGRAIGEQVVLTANGRAIARGELVDLEGDIGIRILEKHP